MRALHRLDETAAKGLATFLGTAFIGLAKWIWEEAKRRGRRKAQTPDAVRIASLERDLAAALAEASRLKTRCEQAEAASFDVRNRWQGFLDERDEAHRAKQNRMYARMKAAEARARALGQELTDLRERLADRTQDPERP